MDKRINEIELPKFNMFIFDEGDEGGEETENTENTGDTSNAGDSGDSGSGDSSGGSTTSKNTPVTKTEKTTTRETSRSGDNTPERIRQLEEANRAKNDEAAQRRRENNTLKKNLDVVTRRLVMTDVATALKDAGALGDRVSELFLSDHESDIRIDDKTGKTTGLDKIAEWKKSNAWAFKPDAGDSGDEGNTEGEGEKTEKRGNSTAAGTSRGSGAGTESKDNAGIPDLKTLKTPQEREAAIKAYKQSLKGSGTGYGYGKASSKK